MHVIPFKPRQLTQIVACGQSPKPVPAASSESLNAEPTGDRLLGVELSLILFQLVLPHDQIEDR
jgi:hypothetical protein